MRKVITLMVLVLMVFTFSFGVMVSSNSLNYGEGQYYMASGDDTDSGTITTMDGPHPQPS